MCLGYIYTQMNGHNALSLLAYENDIVSGVILEHRVCGQLMPKWYLTAKAGSNPCTDQRTNQLAGAARAERPTRTHDGMLTRCLLDSQVVWITESSLYFFRQKARALLRRDHQQN
jgi:hypothetical protein